MPNLLSHVNGCLEKGKLLSDDLNSLQSSRNQMPTSSASKTGLFDELGLDEMSRQTPMVYPFCNDQSVQQGSEQVQSSMQRLNRDKDLLQEQLNACQAKIDHSGGFAKSVICTCLNIFISLLSRTHTRLHG